MRQALGGGRWFDTDKAVVFKEDTWWDGNNYISTPTGSQWDHQTLYFTGGGTWVLNSYSAWQNSNDSWEVICEDTAFAWLIDNDCSSELSKLPAGIRKQIQEYLEEAEL